MDGRKWQRFPEIEEDMVDVDNGGNAGNKWKIVET